MIGVLLALACGGVLWATLAVAGQLRPNALLPRVIMGGYVLRLIIQFFIRDVRFFSHAAGGDCLLYEEYGQLISTMWRRLGVHYITGDELPIGPTSLPQNLFALVIYSNDGAPSRLGCTALVALAAALTALNLYTLAERFGADRKNALLIASLIYFQPAFLFYTSDLYKDGLVLCFTIGALGSALRLGFRMSVVHAAIGIVCIWALWYVRFYLLFVSIAPLLVGAAALGSRSVVRPLLAALILATAGVFLASFTDILQIAAERATHTFEVGTSSRVIEANSHGGSGVVFDDGGVPYGALPAKLAYTLFSPFPWAPGSLGFQIGKLDAFLWYFMVYRAVRAVRHADRRLLLMLGTFIVPCTLMYAMSVSNVGLILRQRLVIVAATAILAALYKPSPSLNRVEARRGAPVRRIARAA